MLSWWQESNSISLSTPHGKFHFHRENAILYGLVHANFNEPYYTREVLLYLQQYFQSMNASFLSSLTSLVPPSLEGGTKEVKEDRKEEDLGKEEVTLSLFYLLVVANELKIDELMVLMTDFIHRKLPFFLSSSLSSLIPPSTEGGIKEDKEGKKGGETKEAQKEKEEKRVVKEISYACDGCGTAFHLYLRPHRCRNCNLRYCYYCCHLSLPIFNYTNKTSYLSLSDWKWWMTNLPYGTQYCQRVCKFCQEEVTYKYQYRYFFKAFLLLAPTFTMLDMVRSYAYDSLVPKDPSSFTSAKPDLAEVKEERKKWKWAAIIGFEFIQSLSVKSTIYPLDPIERRWIWHNRRHLSLRSPLLVLLGHHFITQQASDLSKHGEMAETLTCLQEQINYLTHTDILVFFKSKNDLLLKLSLYWLREASDTILYTYLFYLVYQLRHRREDCPLWPFLIQRVLLCDELKKDFYQYLFYFSERYANFRYLCNIYLLHLANHQGLENTQRMVLSLNDGMQMNYGEKMCILMNKVLEQENVGNLFLGSQFYGIKTYLCEISNIYNHLAQYNGNRRVDEIYDIYAKSLAGYCLACYLIGPPSSVDHLIINSYGNIECHDYNFTNPQKILLTDKMIDAMGGKNNPRYHLMKSNIITGYQTLCRYHHLFIPLFEGWIYLQKVSFEEYTSQVQTKLSLGLSDKEIEEKLENAFA